MRTCYTIDGGPYSEIKLHQHGRNSFRVTYGQQVKDRLTYDEAAAELGGAIMHRLACESQLDNRDKWER